MTAVWQHLFVMFNNLFNTNDLYSYRYAPNHTKS